MSNGVERNKRRQAERRRAAIHLRGELKLLGLSLAFTIALAFVVSNVVPDLPHGPAVFMTFGSVTTLLSAGWIRHDAARAFQTAARSRNLGFEGNPPRVISISQYCPKRWLVLLHIELNPEFISHGTAHD